MRGPLVSSSSGWVHAGWCAGRACCAPREWVQSRRGVRGAGTPELHSHVLEAGGPRSHNESLERFRLVAGLRLVAARSRRCHAVLRIDAPGRNANVSKKDKTLSRRARARGGRPPRVAGAWSRMCARCTDAEARAWKRDALRRDAPVRARRSGRVWLRRARAWWQPTPALWRPLTPRCSASCGCGLHARAARLRREACSPSLSWRVEERPLQGKTRAVTSTTSSFKKVFLRKFKIQKRN